MNEQQRVLDGHVEPHDYTAGKWGRYLRAPDWYFELISRFRSRFVPLGALVDIRFGVKTGCDAFFMPRDVSTEILAQKTDSNEFRKLTGVARLDVATERVRIIKDGAGTLHPVEAIYLKPEVHSLMKVDRPEIKAQDLDRVVLIVDRPLSALRGTYVYKYLTYGETAVYASRKSKAVPVPQRSTCAAREPWYDLTNLVKPGFAFWPMAQQYRHIIPGNPERLICNHNLFDLSSEQMTKDEQTVLVAVLNSTLIGLFKTFYGRFAGTEGNLKTEVLDVNLIDVPDPRGINEKTARRLTDALRAMTKRQIGRMVDESFMDCHSYLRALELASRPLTLSQELWQSDRRQLDDAVLELLGVTSGAERRNLADRLYTETATHFRAIRMTEIQKMEDRAKGGRQRFTSAEQAADAWDALDLMDCTPLGDWVRMHASGPTQEMVLPDELPIRLEAGNMFDHETVYFGKKKRVHVVCPSRGTAELLVRMASLGVTGSQVLPTDNAAALSLLNQLNQRHETACTRLKELAESRTSDEDTQDQVFKTLERWFVLGRSQTPTS